MDNMDHAIEKAAKVADDILSADPQVANEMFGDEPDKIARALADAGLLAPAPLAEEWRAYDPRAGGVRMTDQAQAVRTAHELAMDDADNGIDSDWTVQRRYVSDWLPVDRAEGDGKGE